MTNDTGQPSLGVLASWRFNVLMHRRLTATTAFALLFATCALAQTKPATTKPHNYARWEPNVVKLEQQDEKDKPAKGGVMFVGSSTIVKWKTLATDFPDAKPVNHGF